ncbi:DUF1800 family protein [Aquabacterium sp.]|uniref:DUF1800 domain-containing protein n=1 Tax=Aquabacterium sp. TaxID=1872578 RepID=UPI0037837EF3
MNIFRSLIRWAVPLLLASSAAYAGDITLYSSYKVEIGTSRQLTAYVPLSPNTVSYTVNGVPGGNATVGTISAKGLYTAPAAVPMNNAVVVRATSTAYPAKYGEATMTITQVGVHLWSASPSSVPVGPFTLRLNGSAFTANTVVTFGGVQLASTVNSRTAITATGTATAAQAGTQVPLVVKQTGVGGTTSETVMIAVTSSTTPPPPPPPPPPSVTVSINPSSVTLAPAATRSFAASVSGSTNTAVTWSVNGINGGNATVGTISAAGLYTAPAAVPNPATVTLRATSAASTSAYANASVTIAGPIDPGTGLGTPDLAAGRFLEQAAFGPSPASLARVKQIGVDAWLTEQFAMAETPISNPVNDNRIVQSQFLNRLAVANDQLRQKVAYALSQIIVISMNKNNYAEQTAPYLQILSRNAFGNYRTLLGEIAISSQMGKYLDLANSMKPANGGGANENFPRELMQLFSIGLYKLNLDGSNQLDANGQPIPVYDQTTVQQVALAMTGWTYINNDWENFTGPMVPRDANHDMRAKSFLGCNLPANQSTQQDMNAALDCIYAHPNVAPFISLRLIRSMVKSNPSPAYVQRVATVFNNNGSGVRGDLKAVVRAILTDAEARNDATTPTGGRLKDPIYHIVSMLRALGGSITATNQQAWSFSRVAQTPLTPPSVFSFYSPLFRVPQQPLYGPEFQIYTPTEAVLRGNFIWQILSNPGGDFPLDISRFTALGGNIPGLIDAVDQTLLYGRMAPSMRQTLATAIAAQPDNQNRAWTALYLTLLSGQHAVQY